MKSVRLGVIMLVSAVTAGTVFGTVASAASAPEPTFDTIPTFDAGEELDLSRIPDYVSVLGPDGEVAGYVKKEDLFSEGPAPNSPSSMSIREGDALVVRSDAALTVYDRTGSPVGQWIHARPGVAGGFHASDG